MYSIIRLNLIQKKKTNHVNEVRGLFLFTVWRMKRRGGGLPMVHVWCSERKIMKCDPVGINVTEKKKTETQRKEENTEEGERSQSGGVKLPTSTSQVNPAGTSQGHNLTSLTCIVFFPPLISEEKSKLYLFLWFWSVCSIKKKWINV